MLSIKQSINITEEIQIYCMLNTTTRCALLSEIQFKTFNSKEPLATKEGMVNSI